MVNSNQGWVLRGEVTAAVGREYGWPALKDDPKIVNIEPQFAYAGNYASASGRIRVTQEATGFRLSSPRNSPSRCTLRAPCSFSQK
jgi:hypothetical protein